MLLFTRYIPPYTNICLKSLSCSWWENNYSSKNNHSCFLAGAEVGIKSASSARWASFLILLLSLQRNVYYLSLSHRWTWKFEGDWSKRFFLYMSHHSYRDIWDKQFSTDLSQVQTTQNFSFSAVKDTVGVWQSLAMYGMNRLQKDTGLGEHYSLTTSATAVSIS